MTTERVERVPDAAALEADQIYASYQRGDISHRNAIPKLMELLCISRGEANMLLDTAIMPLEAPTWHDMRTAAEVAEDKMRDLTALTRNPAQ